MAETNIAWATHVWNPFSGCVKVSEGCDHCYAETLAEQKRGTPAFRNGFDLTLRPHKLRDPLGWKEPKEIFVNSMSDLFLGSVPVDYLCQIWRTMLEADWHTYMVLTKRPVPAARLIRELGLELPPHIWIGVSVENQRWADERIPQLLDIPAQVRFLSCEPLLGPIDLARWLLPYPVPDPLVMSKIPEDWSPFDYRIYSEAQIKWVIDGGESGPNRRPADPEWFRSIRDQCVAAGVPYFHKQGNAFRPGQDRLLDGRMWDQHPNRLEVAA